MVVWLPFFIFPCIGNNHPNRLIFFRGVQTTNQMTYVFQFGDSLTFSHISLGSWEPKSWFPRIVYEYCAKTMGQSFNPDDLFTYSEELICKYPPHLDFFDPHILALVILTVVLDRRKFVVKNTLQHVVFLYVFLPNNNNNNQYVV